MQTFNPLTITGHRCPKLGMAESPAVMFRDVGVLKINVSCKVFLSNEVKTKV